MAREKKSRRLMPRDTLDGWEPSEATKAALRMLHGAELTKEEEELIRGAGNPPAGQGK